MSSQSKAGGGDKDKNCGSGTNGLMLVSVLCGLAFLLSLLATFLPWTSYKVAFDSDELAELVNTSKELRVLFEDWPQLFYDRGRHLDKVCFPDMDEHIWLAIFGRHPERCSSSRRGRRRNKAKCYCMNNYDYGRPSDTSNATVADYAVKSEANEILTQKKLLDASFGLMIVACVLSFGLTLSTCAVISCPKSVGTVTFIFIIIMECAIVAVVALFCVADNMERELIQPPHYGFIRNNTMLSLLTSKSSTHGFRLACSVVATVTLMFVFYVWSWCTYMCCEETGGRQCEQCCCCAPSLEQLKTGGNSADDDDFSSTTRLSPGWSPTSKPTDYGTAAALAVED